MHNFIVPALTGTPSVVATCLHCGETRELQVYIDYNVNRTVGGKPRPGMVQPKKKEILDGNSTQQPPSGS